MAQPGLGKNTPIKLSLGKLNYEALLERHGQWIRWRTASKCSCVLGASMQPDIHCRICGGYGVTYSFQKNQIVYTNAPLYNQEGILSLDAEYTNCDLVEVYDYSGKRYKNATKCSKYIYLNETTVPTKGTYFNVVLRKNTIETIYNVKAIKKESGYYEIEDIFSQKPNVDGLYYKVHGDIVNIETIKDSEGNEYQASEYRLNQFTISGDNQPDELNISKVDYIPPFLFVILNQNLSKTDAEMVTEMRGDAICLFPYGLDVSGDDVLTALSGYYTTKEVVTRKDFDFDVLGSYFVYDIVSCTGIVNGQIIEYKEGIDFVLSSTNRIKWLEDNENYPEVGEAYSITYHVLPTYKIMKEIPQLRTSENQRFPKKAVIKLCSTYGENLGLNQQVIDRTGLEGSY